MFVRLLTCLLILAAVAVQRDGRLLGHEVDAPAAEAPADSIVSYSGDTIIVNTTQLGADIKGFGGDIPLEIAVADGRIARITPLPNSETPAFFKRVSDNMIPQWIGMSVDSVATVEVDGVTGATFSSRATEATVKRGMEYIADVPLPAPADDSSPWDIAMVASLIVVLAAAVLPLFVHDRRYRYIQLGVNVIVLGLWTGTFVSYSLLVGYIANGANLLTAAVPLLMIVIAFVYPFFGHNGHYCAWVCPLGSLQELAGHSVRYKLRLSRRTLDILDAFHDWLWVALMVVMCAGIWFDWMDYELFTAFMFRQAAVAVIIVALLFVALSFVVMRPYCRFVCPTGCLFKINQK